MASSRLRERVEALEQRHGQDGGPWRRIILDPHGNSTFEDEVSGRTFQQRSGESCDGFMQRVRDALPGFNWIVRRIIDSAQRFT